MKSGVAETKVNRYQGVSARTAALRNGDQHVCTTWRRTGLALRAAGKS